MKRFLLFSVLTTIALTWACQKTPVIEATPPEPGSEWEELIWIPVTSGNVTRLERKTFKEMTDEQKDSLVFVCSKIVFLSDGQTIKIKTRYGDGPSKPGSDSLHCFVDSIREDYYIAGYDIQRDVFNDDKVKTSYINITGKYTGSGYDTNQAPPPCASVGPVSRRYDYTYENKEKTLLRFGYTDHGRWTFHLFQKQQKQ